MFFSIVNLQGQCEADFSYYMPVSCVTHDTVNFYDNSTNAMSWSWDFGDSTTSTDQNPIHKYDAIGSYHVCLIITDDGECTDTLCKTILVSTCMTGFNYIPTNSVNTLKFFDMPSNSPYFPTQYYWDFGDSTYSNLRFPLHTFDTTGVYQVCLTASDSANSCVVSVCKDVVVGPPYNAKISVCDGYWSDPYTWNSGIVPSSTDSVIIFNHVVMDSDINISSPGFVYISENSSLCGHQLLTSSIIVYGSLNTNYIEILENSYSDFTPINSDNGFSIIGTYMCQIMPSSNTFSCTDPSPCSSNIIIDNTIDFNVYPNPFEYQTEISLSNYKNEFYDIYIYNTQGVLIKLINDIGEEGYILYKDNLPSGLYLIRLMGGEKNIGTRKIIIK